MMMTTKMEKLLAAALLLGTADAGSSGRRLLRSGGGGASAAVDLLDAAEDAASASVAASAHDPRPSSRRRRLAVGPFRESSCNAGVDAQPCASVDAFLSANGIVPLNDEVVIPCGECVTFDATDGSVYDFPRGLNVVGKLHVPEDASFELRTKFVLVQGIFRMDPPTTDTKIPRGDGAVVKVVLTGTDNVMFAPDPAGDNVGGCMAGGCNIGSKPFAVAGGRLDINAIHDSCPTWTKLKSQSADLTKITLADPAAAACWSTGAQLLFTSDTYDPADALVATVQHVNLFTGEVQLPGLNKKLSTVDDEGDMYAVEVALLTRRVRFEPDVNTGLMGGHTIVMSTPNVAQNIKGVEFFRFGQQGRLGRYPVHVHMSDSVAGTTISKNLVRESNQRCYVVHGSHDVSVSDNVAYDTFGHCYMVEDGGEWRNSFVGNLGAMTKNVPQKGLIPDQPESDDQSATFWITNGKNDFVDNVAAGSEDFGMWLDVKLRGPSANLAVNAGLNPMTQDFEGLFAGNVAHSNRWHGIVFYPSNYRPDNVAVIMDVYSYKNAGFGLRLGGSFHLHVTGGVLSDNKNGGVESSGALPGYVNILENLSIVGVSSHLDALIADGARIPATDRPCNIVGATYPPGKSWRGSGFDQFATEYRNVAFDGFQDTTGCATVVFSPSTVAKDNGVPFAVDELVLDGVVIDPATSKPFGVCSAVADGFKGFALDDPASDGFYVQEGYGALTAFLPGGACQAAEAGSCLLHCPNTCFRLLKVKIAGSEVHNGKQLKVTATNTGSTALVPKAVFTDTHKDWFGDVVSLHLPGGGSYSVSFVGPDGTTAAWPGYAEVALGAAPACVNHVVDTDVSIDYPAPNGRCMNPVYNGDVELGRIDGWQDVMYAGMAVLTPGAAGSAYALRTTRSNRQADRGLVNHIDVSCMRAWANKNVRLSGYLRTLNGGLADVANSINVLLEMKDSLGTVTALVPRTAVPTKGGGSWSFFETTIQLPAIVADATVAVLTIDGAQGLHIALDEWRVDVAPLLMPCRKAGSDCSADPAGCMVDSCTDGQVAQGYARLQLRVAPGANPACMQHGSGEFTGNLRCKMQPMGFGEATPWLTGGDLGMGGGVDVGFVNTATGKVLKVKFVRHWSWRSNSDSVFFSVYSTNLSEAKALVNNMFDNAGRADPLRIEVRPVPK